MTDDKRKMAAKIQALIAKANSTEHEEEAEAFMRKASQLLEEHPLFQTERWMIMLRCCSYYFVPFSIAKLKFDDISQNWGFVCRSDFKNYGNELNLFIDWIKPHLETEEDQMIGYSRYEEDREPIIYYGQAQ